MGGRGCVPVITVALLAGCMAALSPLSCLEISLVTALASRECSTRGASL